MTRLTCVAFTLHVAFAATAAQAQHVSTTTVVTGLSDPRGLAFGPAGDLYIAEAWTAPGSLSTTDCFQSAIGPFTGGFTSRIVRVARGGSSFDVVADGFPSSTAAVGDNFGVADVALVGGHLLALSSGGGCSKGHPTAVNSVVAITRDGAQRPLVDLSAWILANPGQKGVEQLGGPDYEPDGIWYSMLLSSGRLLALEANHGLLAEIQPRRYEDGYRVSLVNDLYATFGDHTYTSLVDVAGDLYIGTYGRFDDGFDGAIFTLGADGRQTQVASGLTSILGVAADRRGRLYALQAPIFDGGGAGLGSLVRIERDGSHTVLLTGLASPGSLTLGPDGALYLPQCSFHCAPGSGWVTRVVVD